MESRKQKSGIQKSASQMSSRLFRRDRNAMHHVITTDVMGNRNVEVVPVGAWVEPADDRIQPDAVEAAQVEEEKIRRLQEEKENRLRHFRQQTKNRVSRASHMKRQQQIQEAEQAFELERKVVQQSSLTADMTRKDTCLHRHDLDMAIKNRLMEKYGEDISTWDQDTSENFHSQAQESHQVTDKARQQLMSKRIGQDEEPLNEFAKPWKVKDFRIPAVTSVVTVECLPKHLEHKRGDNNNVEGDHKARDDEDPGFEFVQELNEGTEDDEERGSKHSVQFTDPTATSVQSRKKNRPGSSKMPHSAQLSAVLSKDSESDALVRQRKQQAAVSRRIFMDREREAVRENIRRQLHRKNIVSLKKEKEEYRQELEELAFRDLEPTDPITGETAEDKRVREKIEAVQVKEMVDKRADEMRRAREMERYLDALKHSLIEKVTRQRIQLPALCACGETVWDTHPETCANNCFFYRNHRAYARALQSLLSSVEVM